jgi:dihydroxyacetone kinase-like protein
VKKLINDPGRFVDETIEGILAAHPDQLRIVGPDLRAIVRADAPLDGKVGVVTGGGSGHLPVFMGYVGVGLCTGAAIGNVFSSPSSDQMLEATRASHGGAGVLHLYGNYGGDVFNFEPAAELAADEGIEVKTVLCADDVSSAPLEAREERRGVAGMFFAFKSAGAAAELGNSLDEVAAVAAEANANTRSMGVGLSPAILPTVAEPTFELEDDEMEIGIGIHGEPGIRRTALRPADEITDELMDHILPDLGAEPGERVSVLVNGMGATPKEELYVLYRRVHQRLAEAQLSVHRVYVGEFATSLEMAGASISLMRMTDRLVPLMGAPARSPFFEQT